MLDDFLKIVITFLLVTVGNTFRYLQQHLDMNIYHICSNKSDC